MSALITCNRERTVSLWQFQCHRRTKQFFQEFERVLTLTRPLENVFVWKAKSFTKSFTKCLQNVHTPRNWRNSSSLWGAFQFLIISSFSGRGLIPAWSIIWPRNFTDGLANWHFLPDSLKPALLTIPNNFCIPSRCCSKVAWWYHASDDTLTPYIYWCEICSAC